MLPRMRPTLWSAAACRRPSVLPLTPYARLVCHYQISGAFSMKLSEVAQKLNCRLEGDGDIAIIGVCGIEEAKPGQISFLANRRYFPLLKTTSASAVLIEEGTKLERDSSLPPLAALR